MRLASPWWLLLLPFALVLVWGTLYRAPGRFRFSSLAILERLPYGRSLDPRIGLLALRAIAVALVIISLARPQSGRRFTEITSEGVDIILALDTSGSMQAVDMKLGGEPTPRVEVVKHVAAEFIAKRPTDRIGVVVFGDRAFLQCPLTLDHDILTNLMQGIHVGVAGDATAIGDAIGVAVNHMKGLKAKSRVLVLLTDGQSNSGVIPPLKAAEIAATFGIKVYTIGVGVEGDAPFIVDTPFGKRVIYQRADLDEDTLQKIAQTTGARFFRAKDSETLNKIYEEIDRLEKSEVKVKQYSEYNELYAWFAWPALLLLILEIGLGQTLWVRIP